VNGDPTGQEKLVTGAVFVLSYRVPGDQQSSFFAHVRKLCGQLTSTTWRDRLHVEDVRLLQPMFGEDETVWQLQIRFASAAALGGWMDAASAEPSSNKDDVPSPRALARTVSGVELISGATSPLYRLYSFEPAEQRPIRVPAGHRTEP
jgi:hypothetical protein